MSSALYDPIKTQAKITDSVIVGFSGGKESIVTMDLCCRHFKHIAAYNLYTVPNLSFQERCFQEYERRYNVEIVRLPNTDVARWLKYGIFTLPDKNIPIITYNDIYQYMRDKSNFWWIAGGERAADSIERNAMIKKVGSVDYDTGRFYPLAYWKEKEVLHYIWQRKLPYFDMREGFLLDQLIEIKEQFPQDWEKVKRLYPFLGAKLLSELMSKYDYDMEMNENATQEE